MCTCDARVLPVLAGMLRGDHRAKEACQRLKLLPGRAVAHEDQAPALDALAE